MYGFDVSLRETHTQNGDTALHRCIKNGDKMCTLLLLQMDGQNGRINSTLLNDKNESVISLLALHHKLRLTLRYCAHFYIGHESDLVSLKIYFLDVSEKCTFFFIENRVTKWTDY